MRIKQQMTKTCRAVAAACLAFLAGVGVYSGVQNLTATPESGVRLPLENVQPEQQTVESAKPEPTARPFLGDNCSTCGMG